MKVLTAAAGWMLSLTLAAFGAIDQEIGLYALAILAAFWACVPTYWLMFDDSRARMARIVERLLAEERATTDALIAAERTNTEELIVRVAQEFAEAELPRIKLHRHA